MLFSSISNFFLEFFEIIFKYLGFEFFLSFKGGKSITERAGIIEQSDAALQYMENQFNDSVDLAYLKEILKGIRESYAVIKLLLALVFIMIV